MGGGISKRELLERMQTLIGAELFFLRRVGGDVNCDIFHCHNVPQPGIVTFVTVGLSGIAGREIIMSCREGEFDRCLESIALAAFAVLTDKLSIDVGLVINESDDLPDIRGKTGFYVTSPIYFSGDVSRACWIIPVTIKEVEYIARNGAAAFEEVMNSGESDDLLSIDRAGVV